VMGIDFTVSCKSNYHTITTTTTTSGLTRSVVLKEVVKIISSESDAQ
jgi:hypothetical protein